METMTAPQTVYPYGDDGYAIMTGNGTVIVSGTLTELAEFMDGQPIRVAEG